MTLKARVLASCRCTKVTFAATGKPILSVVCYCDDCQEGARRIESLPDAVPVRHPDGGTPYVLYRKDRFSCVKGNQLLQGLHIRQQSPTKRVVTSCCNSAMFLDFGKGHWVSVYRARFAGDLAPPQMRVQTRFRPKGAEVPRDLPAYATFPLTFIVKLIAARIAMLLHR
jgi:hypothetical protein